MRVFFRFCISLGLAYLASLSSASAQSGYKIKELARSEQGVMLAAASSSGWRVFDAVAGGRGRLILQGPGGYERDITLALLGDPDAELGWRVISVSSTGDVYALVGPPVSAVDSISRETIVFLPHNAPQATNVFSQSSHVNEMRSFAFNGGGKFLLASSIKVEFPIVFQKLDLVSGVSTEVTLPFTVSSKKANVYADIDEAGRFVISHFSNFRTGGLANLCTGSFEESQVTCTTKEQLARLTGRSVGRVRLVGGRVLIERRAKVDIVDLATFSVVSSLPGLGRNFLDTEYRPTDFTRFGLRIASGMTPTRYPRLVISSPSGQAQRYRCSFGGVSKERNLLQQYFTVAAMANESVLVFSWTTTDSASYGTLYELTPIRGDELVAGTDMSCLPLQSQ